MKGKRVSIFINEGDRWHGRPLHVALLEELAREGMAGGTVVRGVAGYTRSAGITTASLVDMGGRLPLVVEFVESEENLERVLPVLSEMAGARLICISDTEIHTGGAF